MVLEVFPFFPCGEMKCWLEFRVTFNTFPSVSQMIYILPNELGLLLTCFFAGNLFVVDWFCVSATKELFYIILVPPGRQM